MYIPTENLNAPRCLNPTFESPVPMSWKHLPPTTQVKMTCVEPLEVVVAVATITTCP